MKVPPASTYLSRIANEAASPVAVPKFMAPKLSTLTSRRVFGSVPIVRYFMQDSSPAARSARTLSTSLGAGAHSRSIRARPGSRGKTGRADAGSRGGKVRDRARP